MGETCYCNQKGGSLSFGENSRIMQFSTSNGLGTNLDLIYHEYDRTCASNGLVKYCIVELYRGIDRQPVFLPLGISWRYITLKNKFKLFILLQDENR
jgi:hypothetical protein